MVTDLIESACHHSSLFASSFDQSPNSSQRGKSDPEKKFETFLYKFISFGENQLRLWFSFQQQSLIPGGYQELAVPEAAGAGVAF